MSHILHQKSIRYLICCVVNLVQYSFQNKLKSYYNSGVPKNFVRGSSTNSVEDRGQRKRGFEGGSPLPLSQGFWGQLLFGIRNFISYSKSFLIFCTLRLFMMTTNLFVIANVT